MSSSEVPQIEKEAQFRPQSACVPVVLQRRSRGLKYQHQPAVRRYRGNVSYVRSGIRTRPQYRPKGRSRRHGPGTLRFVHALAEERAAIDPVVGRILQQLSYPVRNSYGAKDIIWVKQDSEEWIICIIKYRVSDGSQFIVRPLSQKDQWSASEFVIREEDIFDAPPNTLSFEEVQRAIVSLKEELTDAYANKRSEIFQGSLVKYKCRTAANVFAHVTEHNLYDKTFTIKIRAECKWYIGPIIVQKVSQNDIQAAHLSEFKIEILRHKQQQTQLVKKGGAALSSVDLDENENENALYDLLGDMAHLYIDTFLQNGVTNVKIAKCLRDSDLKEMGILLGHRRYIMNLIETSKAKKAVIKHKDRRQLKKVSDIKQKVESQKEEDSKDKESDGESEETEFGKLIIYDFDSILTCMNYGDPLNQMSDEELLQVFGGSERVKRLGEHFKELSQLNAHLVILSFAYQSVIKNALKRLNLFSDYFTNEAIIGGDSAELQLYENKAKYILNAFQSPVGSQSTKKVWNASDILLVDYDLDTIEQVTEMKVCKSLYTDAGSGLTEFQMALIEDLIKTATNGSDNMSELEGVSFVINEELTCE